MIFLDLGLQPLANKYLNFNQIKKHETKFRLLLDFNVKTKIVSIKKTFSSKKMFNDTYPYRSSMSETMKDSFLKLSNKLKKKYKNKKILEIGCNDGAFLKNFDNNCSLGIEPCKNIANLARKKKINVISEYWNTKLSNKIKLKYGKFDIVYSANTITHIKNLDNVFSAIKNILETDGIIIMEDPSLLECIKKNTYDQFYNEHIYVFSLIALSKFLKKHKLRIFKVDKIKVHGGSNRYFICKDQSKIKIDKSVENLRREEMKFSLHKLKTYVNFAKRIKNSKIRLIKILKEIKKSGKKIIGYGATAKSVTILNYCKINSSIIDYFLDVTPEKINKYLPGVKIKIKKYNKNSLKDIHYVFLGAWNFKNEILKKEKKFIKNGTRFITHTPTPRIIR
ncbi:class I SAM-dependent methyltransferase [Candidatus Pelagibacter communis]|uniref:class I SAM-dependent methyltransferase n=1 Tax=Pelagibacter ubique TaxID=198252 RepID=UPI00094C8889|nr:class I SAM-dependent methyltransferase [Candidatus Pelagibacter ubique]